MNDGSPTCNSGGILRSPYNPKRKWFETFLSKGDKVNNLGTWQNSREKDLYRKWTSQGHRQWTPCIPRQARQSPFTYYIRQVKRRRNKSPNLLTSPSFMGECSFFMKVSVHFSWVDDSNKLFGAMLDCNQLTNI
jgi:hypothetical protein